MEKEKKVELLFNLTLNQTLHTHSDFSGEVDGEAILTLFSFLDMCRNEVARIKDDSYIPGVLVSITDHNMLLAYQKGQYGGYVFDKKERNNLLCQEGIKLITGAELSANLNGIKVHTLAYDFNETILGITKYTKLPYRYNREKRDSVKKVGAWVHLSGGKYVLAHPSRYVKEGKISLNDILTAAYNAKCFDGFECATSKTTLEDCFEILRFCAEHNMPITIGTDYHYKGRKSVEGMPGQRRDIFFVESLGMKTGDFLRLVVGKNVDQLNKIEALLKQKIREQKQDRK